MFTPFVAAYNRCRPVRPWNGSLSASLQRRVTTRCWKGSRAAIGAGTILLVPALLFSQQPAQPAQPASTAPVIPEHPEVVNLTLKGVKVVKASELESSIYTTASY